MAATCGNWWRVVAGLKHPIPPLEPVSPPPQLPLLLLPCKRSFYVAPGRSRTANFMCILGGYINGGDGMHCLRIRRDTGGARFFGSFDGGWLFVAQGQTNRHRLLHFNTNTLLMLPDLVSSTGQTDPAPMVMLAATLSASPMDEACFGAAVVEVDMGLDRPDIAFWHMEEASHPDSVATGLIAHRFHGSYLIEDLVFHHGVFCFLTSEENILACTCSLVEDPQGGVRLDVHQEFLEFQEREECLGDFYQSCNYRIASRYLVTSRGGLLMIVRYVKHIGWQEETQSAGFGVYEMANKGHVLVWSNLNLLNGRLLFLGRGCSRCYESSAFPDCVTEGIHFLDDRDYDKVEMMRLIQWDRLYNCEDNGICSWSEWAPPDQVEFRFQRLAPNQAFSQYSSPMWLLPDIEPHLMRLESTN